MPKLSKLIKLKPGDTRQYGSPGTQIFSGVITNEDYSSTLYGTQRFATYDEMRKGDPIIAGLLAAMKLPVLSALWTVEPASRSKKDIEIAEFVHEMLFDRAGFTRILSDLLEFLDFGYSLVEPVYKLEGNFLVLDRLSPRLGKTVSGWFVDNKQRQLIEIEQTLDVGAKSIRIPARKCLLFTHGGSALNFEGVSVLRAMYKSWYFKTNVEKITAIGIERSEIGIPHAVYPQGTSQDTIDELESMLKWLVYHEQSFITHEDQISVDFLETTRRNLTDLLDYFRYQDQAMAISSIAQFIMSGMTSYGGVSQTKPLQDMFTVAQQAKANLIADRFNCSDDRIRDHVSPIELLVRYNFGVRKKLPKLTVSRIQTLNFETFSKILKDLSISKVLQPDDVLEDRIREFGNLPTRDPETTREMDFGIQGQGGSRSIDNSERD